LDAINYLHPFREGNGRTQRQFLRFLALEKKLTLNLNPLNNTAVYERYMSGTVNGDVETLTALILELIEKTPNEETMAAINDRENDVSFDSTDDAINFLRKRNQAKD